MDVQRLAEVVETLWSEVYEASFRGKERGRFCLTRGQLKRALRVERLHASTIQRLQDIALARGLIIIDLDDLFPCVEVEIMRRYRRPPTEVFTRFFPEEDGSEPDEADDEEE